MKTAVTPPIALGVIGVQNTDILSSDFKETALPTYNNAIRVRVTSTDFNESTYKAYLKVSQNNRQHVKYVDSVKAKPGFLKLEILDQITLLSEMKNEENDHVIQYLKNQKNAGVVTAVSLALPQQIIREILIAEAVFLENQKYKQYQIALVRGGKTYKTIDFASTSIFGYQQSYFCWKINGKRKVVLSGIVDKTGACGNDAYRDASKAQEKMDYFKL